MTLFKNGFLTRCLHDRRDDRLA